MVKHLTRKFDLSRHLKTHSRRSDALVDAVDHRPPGITSVSDFPLCSFCSDSGTVSIVQEAINGHLLGDEGVMDKSFNTDRRTGFPCNICGRIFTRKYDFLGI